MSEFTYEDSTGKEFTAKDTADNRVAVKNQGYTISQGIGKTIAEGARGADEVMGDHIISKYNPAMLIPRGLMKGIASLGDARTNEEIRADKLIYSDSSGKEFTAKNTPENIKSLSEQGYKIHDLTTEGARGMASAFGEQSQNQYLFGIPHMTDTPEEKARHNALAEANPGMNIAGGIVGFGAGMATPGLNMVKGARLAERGAVRGLEAIGVEGTSVLGRTGIEVAKHAAQGAAYATPHAIATAIIEKNPTKAAEELGLGLAIGGLFGIGAVVTKPLIRGVGAGAEKIVALQEKGRAAEAGAVEHAALQSGEAKISRAEELIPRTKEEIAAANKKIIESLDETIDSHLAAGDKSGITPGVVSGFNYRKVAADIDAAHIAAGGEGTSKLANEITIFGEHQGRVGETSIPFSKMEEMELLLKSRKLMTPEASKIINNEVVESAGRSGLLNEHIKDIAKLDEAATVVNARIGHIISKGVGYAVGGAIGGIAGHAAIPGLGILTGLGGAKLGGFLGEKLTSTWLEKSGTKLGSWFIKKAVHSDLPSYFIIDANAINKSKMALIPSAITQLATRGALASEPFDATKKILGSEANGRNAEQRHELLSKHIIDAHSNPVGTQAHLQELIAPIAEAHSAVGEIMMEDAQKKMEYIYSILPKNPNVAPQPFAKSEKWKPTTQQLHDFNKQLVVADDPYHVIKELEQGTLTSKQVATLAYLNPEILQSMRDEITKLAFGGKAPNLSYQQKLNMSILMGESMVKTLDYIQLLQSMYSGDSLPGPMNNGGGNPSTGGQPKANKLPSSKETTAQRISTK